MCTSATTASSRTLPYRSRCRDYGYAAGLDYRVAPDATLGFALAGAGTDWSIANALGTGRSDVFQAGLYGSKRWGPLYASAALAYASYWMSTDRFVTVFGTDHLTSNFVAHDFAGRIEGGYRFACRSPQSPPTGHSRRNVSTFRAIARARPPARRPLR